MTTVNEGVVKVHIGGDESDGAGGVRHSLFLFEGPMVHAGDADDWCRGILAKSAPAVAMPRTDRVEETEANGF